MIWSRKHERCLECGTMQIKHIARGLCQKCYQKWNEARQRINHLDNKATSPASRLTADYLRESYEIHKRSLGDIAAEFGCTRQYIHKKLREFGIPSRTSAMARELAYAGGKISSVSEDGTLVVHQKIHFNREFFSNWSAEMAYVLGVIATDGCVHRQSRGDSKQGRMEVAQKEPELLEKLLRLMSCDAKIYKPSGERTVHTFSITDNRLVKRLIELGITPRKSLTLKFPTIPDEYIRHFLRGCWDGDGTIYFTARENQPVAKFVGGSVLFIEELVERLSIAGFPKQTIHVKYYSTKNGFGRSFSIRYTGDSCARLYQYLYSGVPEEQYLSRKFLLFKQAYDMYGDKRAMLARQQQFLGIIRTMRKEGSSYKEIADHLNSLDSLGGKSWSFQNVRALYWKYFYKSD